MTRLKQGRELIWPDWTDRNLAIVLGARAAMSAARAIAGVITAIYLSAEGFSGLRVGLLFLGVALTSAVMSSAIGLFSDAIGRRVFLVVVPLLASISAFAFATSRSQVVLFVFAALGSFGRGAGAGAGSVGPYQPAESAFVAEIVPESLRTDAFGRLAFVSSIGALLGGLLAGLARPGALKGAAAMAAYRPAFLAAAVLSGIAGLMAFALREPPRTSRPALEPGRRGPRLVWPRASWHVLWRFWITNGLNGMAIGLFGPFVSYWFNHRFGASPAKIGLLFAIVNVATLASTLSAAGIARRFGTVPAIVAARVVQGVLLVPMAFAPTYWLAGGIYLVRMIVQRIGLPLRQSFTQMMADPRERASVAALSNLPSQGTQSVAQVLAGYLFDEVGLAAPLLSAGILQTINAGAYAFLFGAMSPERPSASAPPANARTEPAPSGATEARFPTEHSG